MFFVCQDAEVGIFVTQQPSRLIIPQSSAGGRFKLLLVMQIRVQRNLNILVDSQCEIVNSFYWSNTFRSCCWLSENIFDKKF